MVVTRYSDPERLSKPSWRRGGGVRAAPETDSRGDWFRRAWNYVVAPPCMLQGTPLAPNASDSPAKCVPNGGFGTVTTHKVDLVSGALTKSTVRHSAHGAHVRTPNLWCGLRPHHVGLRPRCVPHRLAPSGPKVVQNRSKMGHMLLGCIYIYIYIYVYIYVRMCTC
jgi:hypothetical protein